MNFDGQALDRLEALLGSLVGVTASELAATRAALADVRAQVRRSAAEGRRLAEAQADAIVHAAMMLHQLQETQAQLEREVAERKRIEAELRENMEYMQLAVEAARMRVWTRNVGPDAAESLPAPVHPEDRHRLSECLRQALEESKDYQPEFRIVLPGGTVRWVLARGRLLHDAHGTPVRMIGVDIDITERKSLEEQLRQAHKMDAIGTLANGVAHEFNNLLTVINGYSESLLDTMHAKNLSRPIIEAIKKAGDRAADLTRQIVTFSRMQSLTPRVLDLNAVVAGVGTTISQLLGENVRLLTTFDQALYPVKADRGQFEQVLLHLAANARDAMPSGGTLSLETANVELGEAAVLAHPEIRPGAYVLLTVRDTGCGMDQQTQSRIFEPFFTTKGVGKGTGMGLAMVYGIVRQSDGYIHVTSAPGQGAAFHIYLPRAAEATTADNDISQ